MEANAADSFLQEELHCDCPKQFKIISLYCVNVIEKKLPIKSTVNFFQDDSKSSYIKDVEGRRSVIRKEFLDLIKSYAKYISNHLLSINGEEYLCKDKSIEDVYVEIAKSVHAYLFHGKKVLVKTVSSEVGNEEDDLTVVIIPSVELIYKELKQQLKKSMWNKKNYLQSKLKIKLTNKKESNKDYKISSDEDSGDEEEERVSS